MDAHFKGNGFVFEASTEELSTFQKIKKNLRSFLRLPVNQTVFWMRVKGYPKRINFLNQIGVIFHNEPTSLQTDLECEVFNLKDNDIVADDGWGKQIKLGSRVRGKVSPRELIFLKMLNGPRIFRMNGMP